MTKYISIQVRETMTIMGVERKEGGKEEGRKEEGGRRKDVLLGRRREGRRRKDV